MIWASQMPYGWKTKNLVCWQFRCNKSLISPYTGCPSPNFNSHLNFAINCLYTKQLKVSKSSSLPPLWQPWFTRSEKHHFISLSQQKTDPGKKKFPSTFPNWLNSSRLSPTSIKTNTRKQEEWFFVCFVCLLVFFFPSLYCIRTQLLHDACWAKILSPPFIPWSSRYYSIFIAEKLKVSCSWHKTSSAPQQSSLEKIS